MGNYFGKIFCINSWGESHGKAMGVIIDGCPPGIKLYEKDIQIELDKRKPAQSSITTTRKENDLVKILSGIFENKTTGTPISMIIKNKDQKEKDYESIKNVFRPGHADYTYFKKYGIRDHRGGGRASGRETISRVAAGAVAEKILIKENIKVYAYTKAIGSIYATKNNLAEIENNSVKSADSKAAQKMESLILEMKEKKNSIGGIVEVVAYNVPPGLGEPVFDKLDADIAKGLMSIGSVKGIEIGDGFLFSKLKGQEANDIFFYDQAQIKTKTNRAGGILGGISTGMPIIVRVAIKATSSLGIKQKTINNKNQDEIILIEGRHDPCIVPRIVPVIKHMMNIILCDHLLRQKINESYK